MSEVETSPRHAVVSDDGGFLVRLAGLGLIAGLAAFIWTLIDSMNPSAEALAPTVSVDLSAISPGQRRTVYWQKAGPVFVVHRTPEQIARVRAGDDAEMPFPQADRERVQRDEWLVVVGSCHLGLSPEQGGYPSKWGGWYCPYHDQEFDLSGRLRSKWGGRNFSVPPYYFQGDRWLIIGEAP